VREEIEAQQALYPSAMTILFGPRETAIAADLYRTRRRPRGRELDLAVAACVLSLGGALWTLNPGDFRDIPDLRLV